MENCTQLLFTRKEASKLLSISVRSVDYLLSNGELASRRVGRKVLIPRASLTRFAGSDHLTIRDPEVGEQQVSHE